MRDRQKPNTVVDGFMTMKAAQRAAGRKSTKPEATSASESQKKEEPKSTTARAPKARIGHTAQPTKHGIICYECGYQFTITGRLEGTYCPKCRAVLDASGCVIDTSWAGSVKTIGAVHVAADGVVSGGSIVANDLILEGRIDGGKVQVFGSLSLCSGAVFKQQVVDARDLIVRAGAKLDLRRKLRFRNIEIAGDIRAEFEADGIVIVRAGGFLRGKVSGHHLVVEEGGGLKARVAITALEGQRNRKER